MTQVGNKLLLAEALKTASETRALEIGSGILKNTPEVFREVFADRPAVIVADENTFRAAGQEVLDAFRRAGDSCCEPFIYCDPNLYAEYEYVIRLEESLSCHDAIPIAV